MSTLNFFQNNIGFFWFVITLLGLCVGSFINVIAYRLPIMLDKMWRTQSLEYLGKPYAHEDEKPFNLVQPRSACVQCHHVISWWQNIPLLSFLFLRGKCWHCQAAISWSYPAVELITGLLSLMVAIHYGVSTVCFGGLILLWGLLMLTVIDLRHQLLPDDITQPLLWLGLLFNAYGLLVPLFDAVLGAMGGYMILWLIATTYQLFTGRDGMGQGDFKLLALLGAWVGYQFLPFIILVSSGVGAVVGIGYLFFKRQSYRTPIPFGPYLALAGFIVFLYGPSIIAGPTL